jgi:hypothetical protein
MLGVEDMEGGDSGVFLSDSLIFIWTDQIDLKRQLR